MVFAYRDYIFVSSTGLVPYEEYTYALTYRWALTRQFSVELGGKHFEHNYTIGNDSAGRRIAIFGVFLETAVLHLQRIEQLVIQIPGERQYWSARFLLRGIGILILETLQMSCQFLLSCPTAEVKTEHFVGAFRRLLSHPQAQ